MSNGDLNWIANFIWGIADDVLRDLYVRGKYRDVILPMTALRRLDAVLEPTKKAVIEMKTSLDKAGITNQDQALRQAAGQSFYNTSSFTLRDLRARASQQQLKADFEAYLDGYSPNVQEIIDNFEFRNQIPRLSKADALGTLIEKLLSSEINLSPNPVLNSDGTVKHPALDNHAMGTIFGIPGTQYQFFRFSIRDLHGKWGPAAFRGAAIWRDRCLLSCRANGLKSQVI